ncbi:MAG: hypothetical protein ACXVEF_25890 [Polyangiales bacterium]
MRSFLLLIALAVAGCPKSEKTDSSDKKESESKSEKSDKKKDKGKDKNQDDDEAPAEKPDKKKKDKTVSAEDVGEIPPWAPEKGNAKPCSATASGKTKLKTLQKGDDEDLSNNKADLDALEKDVTGGCKAAEKDLAEALNSGGFHHYQKKKYKQANRWWRAALVVRPSLIVARYNLACGLALDGATKPAIAEIEELARATKEGDPSAANYLEKAKSDEDLASVRDDSKFKDALKASSGNLVGPRKEPEVSAAAVKLLPEDWKKGGKHPVTEQPTVYKPALVSIWTWRPTSDDELLVATVVHDPATVGQPKGDMNNDYGGIVVLKRGAGGKLELLLAKKTGESPPTVAGGPGNTVKYGFYQMCGDLRGSLAFKNGKVVATQMTCEDLDKEPAAPTTAKNKTKFPTCKANEELVSEGDASEARCAKPCTSDADCKPKTCGQGWMVDRETGTVYEGVGKSIPVCEK